MIEPIYRRKNTDNRRDDYASMLAGHGSPSRYRLPAAWEPEAAAVDSRGGEHETGPSNHMEVSENRGP